MPKLATIGDHPGVIPVGLRVCAQDSPLTIDDSRPVFSWRVEGVGVARAFEVVVEKVSGRSRPIVVWAHEVPGGQASRRARYDGDALESASLYRWRVRSRIDDELSGSWSAWATFETGLLDTSDWRAEWIADEHAEAHRPIYLQERLVVPSGVVRARAYVSALGWYRLLVEGTDLTGSALVPRFTPFDREVEYQAYLLDEFVQSRTVELTVIVADGRYRGALGMHNRRDVYGDQLAALVQVLFETADGERIWVGSDASWTAVEGPILAADPKFGETVDLRLASPSERASPAPARRPVGIAQRHNRRLAAESTPRVRSVEELPAVSVSRRDDGSHIVDFGQNFAGVVRIRVAGARGTLVSLQHAEDLDSQGNLDWAHLDREGAADPKRPQRFQRDEFILDGTSRWVQPWCTIHGFRYVQVHGLDVLRSSDIVGVVLSSIEAPTGSFQCSNELINRLWRNAYWSLRSNFTDVPTDCPTRERGGFTGDAMLFAPAASRLADVQTFLRRYLASVAIEQLPDGRVPMIAPAEYSVFSRGPTEKDDQVASSVGWGDATVLLPWTLYESYADEAVLEAQYESMQRWLAYLEKGGAREGFIWGEWIRPGEDTMTGLMRDNTENRLNIGLAYFAHSARRLAEIARVLGREHDAVRYAAMSRDAVTEWRAAAIRADGQIGTGLQDDYVRALGFDLLPKDDRLPAVERLVALIEQAGDHLATGFLSTPMLLPVLTRFGHADVAYRLLLQTSAPSWLGMVADGATTILEHWSEPGPDGLREGSSNHYALGSVVEWLSSGILGISATAPGYRSVSIAPVIGGGLTHANGSVDTPFGPVRVAWRAEDGVLCEIEVTLPSGVIGEIARPDGSFAKVTSGTTRLVFESDQRSAATRTS
ncbi:family 78 glycoside hydrolase catalytic domain [Nocardia sp. NPDC058499]|uniref:family 78 glycoside hydrolase catalytic domain n=1 Tax=Nocardia sp. NPDC058499 TaxID=3346530 RepID=UPI00365D8DD7